MIDSLVLSWSNSPVSPELRFQRRPDHVVDFPAGSPDLEAGQSLRVILACGPLTYLVPTSSFTISQLCDGRIQVAHSHRRPETGHGIVGTQSRSDPISRAPGNRTPGSELSRRPRTGVYELEAHRSDLMKGQRGSTVGRGHFFDVRALGRLSSYPWHFHFNCIYHIMAFIEFDPAKSAKNRRKTRDRI